MEHLIQEMSTVQEQLVILEGLMEVAKNAAYNGSIPVLLGNSLDVMIEYLGKLDERLEDIEVRMKDKLEQNIRCAAPSDKSSAWRDFVRQKRNREKQSEEVTEAYDRIVPFLELLPADAEKDFYSAVKEVGAAAREQGFLEGLEVAFQIGSGKER